MSQSHNASVAAAPPPQVAAIALEAPATDRGTRTRAGSAWFGLCTAALLAVVLIIFMLQNTGSVQVNFLGMSGSLPLALALLIAAVGAAMLTMVVGTVRIAQLRRLSRHRRELDQRR
ncbi:lipopolysaccharide assembly LapA domain-containing protein [Krasilnikovia sp. M28-CT-15]|uniref:LapA family protein n=1 Tax=Krasilnikovia sp. M28-CT-15 TaxID=3373540 RepID=UPI0038769B89